MDGYNPGSFHVGTIQGHLLQFNQKPPLVKSTWKCEVKVPKTQESIVSSEVSSMLAKDTTELGWGNKGFFTYPFLISKKNGESHFFMNLKLLNQFITCTKYKMTTLKQIREAICPGQWEVSLNIKSAYCHIPITRRYHCSLCFRWEGKVYQFKTLPIGLATAVKTFTRVMKPILHLCWKMGKTVCLHLDDALVLVTSYTQAKADGQRVGQLLQRLGFVLSLEKCQSEPTQEFTHLGLVFNIKNMTLSLTQDKVLTIKAQAARVASSPTCRGVMRLLGLTNFASMVLPLARLHSDPNNTGSRITRLQLTWSKGWSQMQRFLRPCIGGTPSSNQRQYLDPK